MSFIGDIFKGKQDPVAAQLTQAASADQANKTFADQQAALAQQAAFLQAIQGQNGVQNQSDVYKQLTGIAAGVGPNPALAQLQNATGQNVANQAALMASQRGAGANAGLIARQAANQGADLQQQAAGQAAALQAQQRLNAITGMGNIANQQVSNQQQAAQALNQAALGGQQNILGAIGAQNQAALGNANSQNQVIMENNKGRGIGSALGGIGSIASGVGALFAHGGEVKGGGPSSSLGKVLMGDGGEVPGEAKVSGDSLKNDTVPALLSPGEIVIPRTITQGPDAPKKSAEFVAQVLSRKRKKK